MSSPLSFYLNESMCNQLAKPVHCSGRHRRLVLHITIIAHIIEIDRDRERDTHRQTDRQTDKWTDILACEWHMIRSIRGGMLLHVDN